MQDHTSLTVEPLGRRADIVYATPEYLNIIPYKFSYLRWILYIVLFVLSGGILLIVSVWFPQIFTIIARSPLPHSKLGNAEYLLVLVHEDGWMHSVWVEVAVHRLNTTSSSPWIWFEFKKHRYVYNHQTGVFERYLATVKTNIEQIHTHRSQGFDPTSIASLTALFGPNIVDIDAPSIPMLLFTKVVHPFYLFQVFSALVWIFQDYTVYACVILLLSASSLIWEIYSEVSNSNRLRRMVQSDRMVYVYRAGKGGKAILIHERDLVPGDIVQLSVGTVCADILLLNGGCVVDEASLTGEAVPINKQPLNVSDSDVVITDARARIQMKASFLHAGSVIKRTRDNSGICKGMVLSTGFSTGKGELFRSIIFPRPLVFEFQRDSYRYLLVLSIVAFGAFIKRLIDFSHQGYDLWYTIINSLDLVTIAVPPALPLVLSSGVGFSLERLLKQGIFCIDSQRINSCGQLDCFCFDKTGTLTEESLTFVGVDEVKGNRLKSASHLDQMGVHLKYAMTMCHSLSMVDGMLQGYALEIAMFEAVTLEGKIERVGNEMTGLDSFFNHTCRVIKRFSFDAHYQRSSVIVEWIETKKRILYVKGSPEAIRSIAMTTPDDFNQKSLGYAADGYYCIAFGMRELTEKEIIVDERDVIERDVEFIGIARFHNELKPESKDMIKELYQAQVDIRMITGDNALTAVHVARLLEMKLKSKVAVVDVNDQTGEIMYYSIDTLVNSKEIQWTQFEVSNMSLLMDRYDLAITGAAIENLQKQISDDLIQTLLSQVIIFARIRPQAKAWIVEQLIQLGHVVGMCGDGTNDCGALKAAHVGLALSSAEASIVAPFTSKAKAITDVPVLIREGRCALMTSFLGFKYMVLYPIIQLGMAGTLGHLGYMLSNNQYIWDDLGIVLGLSMTMLYTASSNVLSKERPPNTLFSLPIMGSILGQIVLYIIFFVTGYILLTHQTWYCRRRDGMTLVAEYMNNHSSVSNWGSCAFYQQYANSEYVIDSPDDIFYGHEGTYIWLFGHLMYFSVAAAFNLQDQFRLPSYTNKIYTCVFTVTLGICLWFLLDPSNTIANIFQTVDIPMSFRIALFCLFVGHVVCALGWEIIATRGFVHVEASSKDELRRISLNYSVVETPSGPPTAF